MDPKLIHEAFIQKKKTLALAESCTGGAITARLVEYSGASLYLLGSLVVYSNAWKEFFLGVSSRTLQTFGAVSKETVEEMLEGLLAKTSADVVFAISGVLGPTGGSEKKPVGTVFLGAQKRGKKGILRHVLAPKERRLAIDFCVQEGLSLLGEILEIRI